MSRKRRLVWFFVCSAAAGCLVFGVAPEASCDAWSKEIADRFSCGGDCERAWSRQLTLLEPSDYDARKMASALRPLGWSCWASRNSASHACLELFRAGLSEVRALPVTASQAQDGLSRLAPSLAALDQACGSTWVEKNCDAGGCPPRNQTCVDEEGVLQSVIVFQKLLIFHSLRREQKHLEYIEAACFAALNQECFSFVRSKMAEQSLKLQVAQPRFRDLGLDMTTLEMRRCQQGTNGSLPCLTELLTPLLRAQNRDSALSGLREMSTTFLTPILPPFLEAEIVQRALVQSLSCHSVEYDSNRMICRSLARQIAILRNFFSSIEIHFRFTASLVERISSNAHTCWINCALIFECQREYRRSQLLNLQRLQSLIRLGAILCKDKWCVDVTLGALMPLQPMNTQTRRSILHPALFLVGLLVSITLLICSIACILLVILIWKIARPALLYLSLLLLVMISEIILIAFWILSLSAEATSEQLSIINLLAGSVHFSVYMIAVVVALDWVFALPVVMQKEPFSSRAELIVRIVFLGVSVSFLVAVAVVGVIGHGVSSAENREIVQSSVDLGLSLRVITLALCGFVFGCSVLSFMRLKLLKGSSPETLQGLKRLSIVYFVLFLAVLFQCVLYGVSLLPLLFLPDWLMVFFSFTAVHAVRVVSILYILLMGAKSRASKITLDSVGVFMKKSLLHNADEGNEADEVPLQYRI